jgi:hypothetical protein
MDLNPHAVAVLHQIAVENGQNKCQSKAAAGDTVKGNLKSNDFGSFNDLIWKI